MMNKIDWPQDHWGKIYDAASSEAHCAMSAEAVELDWNTCTTLQFNVAPKSAAFLSVLLIVGQAIFFKTQLKVSLCLLATYYAHIITFLGCRRSGVKTGTSGWPHLRASATLYRTNDSRKKKSHEKLFRGIWLSNHPVSLIFTTIKLNP